MHQHKVAADYIVPEFIRILRIRHGPERIQPAVGIIDNNEIMQGVEEGCGLAVPALMLQPYTCYQIFKPAGSPVHDVAFKF